jgi:predicted phage tail protein
MTYWGGNQIVALADMPRDVDYSYTNANTLDGKFTYSSSTSKTRYTTALVSYSDPANAYADAMEPVFEQDLVRRFGYNQLELTAIGCTRQSEANRKGRWGILTNNKDRVVRSLLGLTGIFRSRDTSLLSVTVWPEKYRRPHQRGKRSGTDARPRAGCRGG